MAVVIIIESILILGLIIYIFYNTAKYREKDKAQVKLAEERRAGFVSIISHQLRTPLSVIKGYIESLLSGDEGELNDGQREYLSEALSINNEMIDLINDYLNEAQMDNGKIELNLKSVDLAEIVQDIINELNTFAKAANCQLDFIKPANKLPPIQIDLIKVRQAIQNIISNAIKYSKKGGHVAVKLNYKDNQMLFSCEDDGVGIPRDQMPEIFTKFFRARNILQKDTKGSGLGLYFAKVIIESSGGKIWLESTEGKGTKVYFSLPVK